MGSRRGRARQTQGYTITVNEFPTVTRLVGCISDVYKYVEVKNDCSRPAFIRHIFFDIWSLLDACSV